MAAGVCLRRFPEREALPVGHGELRGSWQQAGLFRD